MTNNDLYKMIYQDHSEFKIWKKLDNGCYIGTLGYSLENAKILMTLLQSFAEQYGEVITLESAIEELMLYHTNGKLFIYFDEFMKPVSMNGVTYNEDNVSVDFKSKTGQKPTNLYFYGLSTIPEYRKKGACTHLIDFAIQYAYANNFDLVYARTDLIGSNSEAIMEKKGLSICKMPDEKIIVEWVQVTENQGDARLHMWLPLHDSIYLSPKKDAPLADSNTREIVSGDIIPTDKLSCDTTHKAFTMTPVSNQIRAIV